MKNIDGDKPDRDQRQERSLSNEGLYDSQDLFGDHHEITICHNGELYRLRKTKTGKLILNK